MRAPIFKGVGLPLAIETVPDPTPRPGELVLKVGRCGICGTDLHKTGSQINPFKIGTIIGHEFSGEVVAIGTDVDTHKIGDRVAAMPLASCGHCGPCRAGDLRWCTGGVNIWYGGAGQYALSKAHASIKLPSSLSIEDGALIEPLAVSLHAVSLAGIETGASVLVLGSGAIGLAATFWSRRMGADRIVVASRSHRGEALARQFGATDFVTFGEDFERRVETALNGPPDIVFECIGRPGTLAQAVNAVRSRGTVILVGNCMEPDTITPCIPMFKEVRIQGSSTYSVRDFENCARMFDLGAADPAAMITDTLTYETLPEGFEALRMPTRQCKVLVAPWGLS